jgi:hypothetical protein
MTKTMKGRRENGGREKGKKEDESCACPRLTLTSLASSFSFFPLYFPFPFALIDLRGNPNP